MFVFYNNVYFLFPNLLFKLIAQDMQGATLITKSDSGF